MSNNRLLYSECLRIYNVNESFLDSLQDSGLIRLEKSEEGQYIHLDSLADLEQFIRWHYDMEINVPGIEALHHMLEKVSRMQQELTDLRNELLFYRL